MSSRASSQGFRSQHGWGSRSCVSSTTGSKLSSKYGNIKAAINTGLNMRKINEKYPEAKINARFKKEENFRRMKPTTLLRLLHEKQMECLLLDIREKDKYETCHLKGALSYPAPLLRRSVNVFTVEILTFMNKEPQKIIVFYDDESEHAAMCTGNLFVEKGIENIFLLSGGLREMALNYPEMIEGEYARPDETLSRLSTSNSSRASTTSRLSARV